VENQTATPEDGEKAAHTSSQERPSRQFFSEAHPGYSDTTVKMLNTFER